MPWAKEMSLWIQVSVFILFLLVLYFWFFVSLLDNLFLFSWNHKFSCFLITFLLWKFSSHLCSREWHCGLKVTSILREMAILFSHQMQSCKYYWCCTSAYKISLLTIFYMITCTKKVMKYTWTLWHAVLSQVR